jgi:hypothetical protein
MGEESLATPGRSITSYFFSKRVDFSTELMPGYSSSPGVNVALETKRYERKESIMQ